jgi:hypothetical protein
MRAMTKGGGPGDTGAGGPAAELAAVDARVWDTIARLLADPGFFAWQWERNPHVVRRLWAQLEATTGHRIVDAYAAAVEDPAAGLLYGPGLPRLLGNAMDGG